MLSLNVCSLRVVAAIFCLASCVQEAFAAEPASTETCFRVFDATNYGSKPDLAHYGLERAIIISSTHYFWPRGASPGLLLPEKKTVTAAVRQWMDPKPAPPLVILDLEHWPNAGEASVVESSVDRYITLFDWVKEGTGNAALGYYGIPPVRDYWRATSAATSIHFQEWQRDNDRFERLAATVDVLLPSLYTFYDDQRGWERYAIENVKEARRLAKGKPVYPFIWPRYHGGNQQLKGQAIPADYWRLQLKTLERVADGVVIWSDPEPWNGAAAWWEATREFMKTSHRTCGYRVLPEAPKIKPIR